jgi:hypothetical protein
MTVSEDDWKVNGDAHTHGCGFEEQVHLRSEGVSYVKHECDSLSLKMMKRSSQGIIMATVSGVYTGGFSEAMLSAIIGFGRITTFRRVIIIEFIKPTKFSQLAIQTSTI